MQCSIIYASILTAYTDLCISDVFFILSAIPNHEQNETRVTLNLTQLVRPLIFIVCLFISVQSAERNTDTDQTYITDIANVELGLRFNSYIHMHNTVPAHTHTQMF